MCNNQEIEVINSPLNYHRATGWVDCIVGSLMNFVLTYENEKVHGILESMVERIIRALKFAPTAALKIIPFKAYHGWKTNTVLRNLMKKPSLQNFNWDKVLRQKSAC